MKRTMMMGALMAILVVGPVAAQDAATSQPQTIVLGPPHGDGPPITLGFEGKRYGADGWLNEGEPRRDDAEAFVQQVVATNRDGDLDAMVALWSPDQQDAIRASAGDGLFERNQGFFRSITGTALRARVDYGDFHVFLVQHDAPQTETGSTVNVYPIQRIDGRFYMTNALQDDLAFRYLVQVYRSRLIEQPSVR